MLPIILALVMAEAALFAWWVKGRRQAAHAPVPAPITPADLRELDRLGSRDGKASVPNNLTIGPFPTPDMDRLYLEGEAARSRLQAEQLRRTRSLRVRVEVTSETADHLAKLAAEVGLDSSVLTVRALDASQAAKSAAAARSALETAEREHRAVLDAVDANTEARVARYWGANLRARNRTEPDMNTELDAAKCPKAAAWRAWHAGGVLGAPLDEDGER